MARRLWERLRYSDLKEAALSGVDDLWVLNAVGVVLAVWGPWVVVCREDCNAELVAAEELQHVA